MIDYHGTPITPREQLLRMSGPHFCVSFAAQQDLDTCLRIGQSLMLDNGAFWGDRDFGANCHGPLRKSTAHEGLTVGGVLDWRAPLAMLCSKTLSRAQP